MPLIPRGPTHDIPYLDIRLAITSFPSPSTSTDPNQQNRRRCCSLPGFRYRIQRFTLEGSFGPLRQGSHFCKKHHALSPGFEADTVCPSPPPVRPPENRTWLIPNRWGERPTQQNAGLLSSRAIKHDDVFWEHKWPFVETPTIIKPGNYEYPFDVVLKGDLYESLEGLSNAHVIYRLKAKIVRGTFSHDIVAKKHLRIIRTIAPESLELSQTVVS